MRDIADSLVAIVLMVGTFFLSAMLCALFYGAMVSSPNCKNYEKMTGLKTTYHTTGTCYVTFPDGRTFEKETAEKILSRAAKPVISYED